jgi:dCTP diphosphatase
MTDHTTTFEEIKSAVAKFAKDRDWEQFHAPKNLTMAIAAEAGELLEHYLWVTTEASSKLTSDPQKRDKVAEELADIIILSLQFSNMTGIDVAAAITSKLQKNAAKYPVEKAKGWSSKYTEL